ncbi:MAG TPA: di-heme oxidoredictase family protein, partial [Candidatus Dormibacteraeota bacterium]|nr:di-heme oxidoredictase family protein [Candidatus Dormibacteraeota bacterium]
GLVEQIPDEAIRAACGTGHPDPAKMMGSLPHNAVARFGVKPFVGTVADFVDGALFMECSVTAPLDHSTDDDAFPDPEVDVQFVETLAAFIRGLPPPPRNGTDAAGETAFRSLGCATCHVPDMPPAMGVFSDFCVHRMGAALANGIVDHAAQGDEYRTTPLWGLRFKSLYLHDGRAQTLDAAVTAHDGEALAAATAYRQAPDDQRAALLRFLATL